MGIHRRNIEETVDEDTRGRLRQNSMIVKELSRVIRHGGFSLKTIPEMIKKIIREGIWRIRIDTIEIIEFDTFDEFIAAELPYGLDATIEQIWKLCDSDPEAQQLIQGELKRPPGGNNNPLGNNQHTKKEDNFDNIQVDQTKAPTGTSRAAGLRRLEKDRPDLLAEVIAGKMAVNGAMVEAGFRKHTITVTVDVEAIARKLRRTLDQDQIDELIQLLQGD